MKQTLIQRQLRRWQQHFESPIQIKAADKNTHAEWRLCESRTYCWKRFEL